MLKIQHNNFNKDRF